MPILKAYLVEINLKIIAPRPNLLKDTEKAMHNSL
jgi:hypothetical protein